MTDDLTVTHPEKVGEWKLSDSVSAIAWIDRATVALEGAHMEEVLTIRDASMAAEIFATAQGYKDVAQQAKILQLKAERKAGAWLAENIDHEGGRPKQGQGVPVLSDLDIHPKESIRWQLEASLPEDRFNEWVDECLAHAWELSAGALRRIAENHNGKSSDNDPYVEKAMKIKRIFWQIWQPDHPDYPRAVELFTELYALILRRTSE